MAIADIILPARSRSTAARSIVVSPLLNLAPARPTGATLRHHRAILPIGDSRISGKAMLSLAPDHRSVEICLWFDEPVSARLRLCRLDRDSDRSGESPEEDGLLILEISASGSSVGSLRAERRFSLDDRQVAGTFRPSDLRKAGACLSELRAESVDGVRAEPALAKRTETRAIPYFSQRMLVEIEAAERSSSAVAAKRHVELAILYARGLHSPRAGAG